MVVVTEVVTGLDVVAADMVVVSADMVVVAADMVVVAASVDVVAADMVVVAEVVTGLEVVAVLDVTRTVVAGVGDAISPATSPLNSIRSLCPLKMIFLLVLFIFLLR